MGAPIPTMENGCHSDSWPRLHALVRHSCWAPGQGIKGRQKAWRWVCSAPGVSLELRTQTDEMELGKQPSPLPVCKVPAAQGGLADHRAWLPGAKTQTETRPRPPNLPGIGILPYAHVLHAQYTHLHLTCLQTLRGACSLAPGHTHPPARAQVQDICPQMCTQPPAGL